MTEKSKVRKPSQARSKATVEAILEGASQVLRAEGLEACSTTKIARRAGVSVGTLYQYFANKEAIFSELVDRVLGARVKARAEVIAAQPDNEDLGAAMWSLIGQLFAIHLVDPELHHQLHRWELTQGLGRLDAYKEGIRQTVEAALQVHAARFRPLEDLGLSAFILVHGVTAAVERLALDDPLNLARDDVRREIAALMAGYLSPDNPVATLG